MKKRIKNLISFVIWIPTVMWWTLFLFSFKLMCEICVRFGLKTNYPDNTMVWHFQGVVARYQVRLGGEEK